MATIDNYLTPDMSQIRHSIKGIDDSYNNNWDILAELIQNSVDAIRQKNDGDGVIKLQIDCVNKKIKIYDNGIGIPANALPGLLKPFSTSKRNNYESVGEKGVGLKFVIFSSNNFYLKTANSGVTSFAKIDGAYDWKNSESDIGLPLDTDILDENFVGTEIEVSSVHDADTLFSLTFEQMRYVLLTKTALGSTKAVFDSDSEINISIELDYTDNNAVHKNESLPFKYFSPMDLIAEDRRRNSVIDLQYFNTWMTESDRTDVEKRNKLRDKLIYKFGEVAFTDQRRIKYMAFFLPTRGEWDKRTLSNSLATEDMLADEEWRSTYSFCMPAAGITLSVKGMPTGISIDHPNTGFAGYWSNMFILFEDPGAKFDIGRKSVPGRTVGSYRAHAKDIFNEFLRVVSRYVGGDIDDSSSDWNKEETFNAISNLVSINSDKTSFKKNPTNQEASVAAMFYESIGRGTITGITPLASGYRNRYDLYALWNGRKIVIEFKSQLRNILRDFNDEIKMFNDMDCVVCWEVTDEDFQALRNKGISVEPIEESELQSNNSGVIPHSTHIMRIPNVRPLYVIDLKQLIMS